ncbi:hypothetical protein A2U01_0053722, partial [Trifolium medium]|nr:hypothetical protein [Trifolium medium]
MVLLLSPAWGAAPMAPGAVRVQELLKLSGHGAGSLLCCAGRAWDVYIPAGSFSSRQEERER